MALTIYNTQAREKQLFKPIDPKNVRMYVCGPTVYDFAHIGNARPVIVFDVLFRLLRYIYGRDHVTYVRNITDVDDKINKRAQDAGKDIRALTDETAENYKHDMRSLGNLDPSREPRVTDTIPEIIQLISKLISSNHAYEADGHVLFYVPSMPDYGKFSGRSIDEMIAGARVDVAPYKRSPMDFVLWKPSTPGLPGWDSPWGRGRPGWHIECSAMAETILGDTFDIHGGGQDLIFPHHENEIAQSTCAHRGAPLANYWMHNAMLNMAGEKMAKSVGNVVSVRDLLTVRNLPGVAIRLQMLTTHYRHPIDWTEEQTHEARVVERRWAEIVRLSGVSPQEMILPDEVLAALSDDLNTPAAFREMHAMASRASRGDQKAAEGLANAMEFFGFRIVVRPKGVQSIGQVGQVAVVTTSNDPALTSFDEVKVFLLNVPGFISVDSVVPQANAHIPFVHQGSTVRDLLTVRPKLDDIVKLVEARTMARKAKDFAEADRIRKELTAMGVAIEDGPGGTTWKPVS